jgi:hypothetical protein
MGQTGPYGGIAINSVSFVGAEFQVSDQTDITRVGGHFSAGQNGAAGTIFAALVRLETTDALPRGNPFEPSEVIATALLSSPSGRGSREITVPLPAHLTSGSYLIVFGSGLFGATGEAGLTTVNPTQSPQTFALYSGDNHSWYDSPLSAVGDPMHTLRIIVQAVPEPNVAALLIFAVAVTLKMRNRNRSRTRR